MAEPAAPHAADRQPRRHWFRCGPAPIRGDDGDVVPVFDPATAETHFLNELPLLLLSEIGPEPCDFDTLVAAVGGGDIDESARQQLFSVLLQLEDAELVESELRSTSPD